MIEQDDKDKPRDFSDLFPSHPVYYRILYTRKETIAVVTMQDFDEVDYDQKRFLTKEQFPSEDAAHNWIVEKQDFIVAALAVSKTLGYPVFSQID